MLGAVRAAGRDPARSGDPPGASTAGPGPGESGATPAPLQSPGSRLLSAPGRGSGAAAGCGLRGPRESQSPPPPEPPAAGRPRRLPRAPGRSAGDAASREALSRCCYSSNMATSLGASQALHEPLGLPPQEQPECQAVSGGEEFVYGEEDFVLSGVGWWRSRSGGPAGSRTLSRFDRALQAGWEERMKLGLFRYQLGELQTRILPGDVRFVAQLNIQRGLERRRPQDIQSVRQKFDPQQFHFNKIKPGEILFHIVRGPTLRPPSRGCSQVQGDPPESKLPGTPDCILVVINVSPLEFGHVLFLPDPALCLPQILTQELLQFGLESVLLSAHPGFRAGFNSLGAFASVNHLHLHGFYLDWELLIETAPGEPLCPPLNFYFLRGVPAPGFLFYSEGESLGALAHNVCRVTDYLVDKEIAHNVFVTRGTAPGEPTCSETRSGIRVLIWARRSCFGTKEETAFNVALCELAGHLPIKTAQDFQSLTERAAIHIIQRHLLPEPQVSQLRGQLVALLTE